MTSQLDRCPYFLYPANGVGRNGLVCPSICPSEGLEEKSNKQFWRYIKSQRLEAFRVTPAEGTRPGSLRLPQAGFHLRLSVQVHVHCLICDEVSASIHVHGPSLPPIPDVIISEQGVKKLLKGVDLPKVFGPDQVPCRMLQELHEELAPVFTAIFRNSHESGNLPEVCKSAWISPVFQGDQVWRDELSTHEPYLHRLQAPWAHTLQLQWEPSRQA